MADILQYIHFLRPVWLAALPIAVYLWWAIRPRKRVSGDIQDGIAPHLAIALQVGQSETRKVYPIDGVAIATILLVLAVAGPAWNRIPNPLVAETAPLVVALKVTESMENQDLAPSRLERARFKILDLVSARAGARTALVAYAGTAHRVTPLTEDPNILRPVLEGLSPEVMPKPGDNAAAALALAQDILQTSETPGAILFVLDDLGPENVPAFRSRDGEQAPPVVFLVAAPETVSVPQLDQIENTHVVQLSPDDSDIASVEQQVRSVHEAALQADESLAWNDRGWWLAWPAALLALFWFRRGWTMRWCLFLAIASGALSPSVARADGWVDWFLTPDQQGRLAFEDNDFARAAELFETPMWNGFAKYKAGQYDQAADVFGALPSADAAFAQGMAQIRNREYRPAVRSFETALERQPDFPEAARNLEIATAIVEYVESTREQSDTGEESGIGADDVVFDNEASRGAETQMETGDEEAVPLTSEQWMQSIDTDMGDFLHSRFLLDTAEDS